IRADLVTGVQTCALPICPQERRNRVDDGLKPGSLLAELFESIAQFVVFRILGQLTHDRSVNRDVRTMLAVLKTGGIALNFRQTLDRKSTRLNSSHQIISY